MLKYKMLLTGQFDTNTFLVYDKDTLECVLIDPGADIDFIISKIREDDLKPVAIWLTHGHFDHAFAAGLLSKMLDIPVFMSQKDEELLELLYEKAIEFGFSGQEYIPIEKVIYLEDGDTLKLGDEIISVFEAPGHTKGSLCYATSLGVFVGDVIFEGSIGRSDLHGGNYNTLINSITSRILTLPDDTVLFPGHGRKTSVGVEKRTNPFLT